MNRHVNLTKRIRAHNGLRFCPAVRRVVAVRDKPELGFSLKAYKGCEVRVPDKLVQALKRRKAAADVAG